MLCDNCKSNKNISNFTALIKQDEKKDTIERIDFCHECLNELTKSEIKDLIDQGFRAFKISRCSCYDDCKKIDNIRKMCEDIEPFKKENTLFNVPYMGRAAVWCKPGEGGIIKATIKLYETLDLFDKKSSEMDNHMLKYSKKMNLLTWCILILTIINIFVALKTEILSFFFIGKI